MMRAAVHAFPESLVPAQELAKRLHVEICEVGLHRFPDGESLVQIQPGSEIAILFRSLDRPNEKLVELLLAASALRGNGARRVIIVAPYLGYMRQDIAFEPGQAVSQKVVGALLAEHFDALLTVDPHLHRIRRLAEVIPDIEAVHISAAPALARFIDDEQKPVLVGPDAESRQWVEAIAEPHGLDVIIGDKQRQGDREVALVLEHADRVSGRPAILVDDVISSGRTLEVAAGLLLAAGATNVEALATHCLASEVDLQRLGRAGIRRVSSTDSVAGPTAAIPLAGLLADAIVEHGWLEEKV
jgi:ribose-phosphate pyrophosphokinase